MMEKVGTCQVPFFTKALRSARLFVQSRCPRAYGATRGLGHAPALAFRWAGREQSGRDEAPLPLKNKPAGRRLDAQCWPAPLVRLRERKRDRGHGRQNECAATYSPPQ